MIGFFLVVSNPLWAGAVISVVEHPLGMQNVTYPIPAFLGLSGRNDQAVGDMKRPPPEIPESESQKATLKLMGQNCDSR